MLDLDINVKLISTVIALIGLIVSVFNLPGAIIVFIALCVAAFYIGIAPIGATVFLIFAFLAVSTVFVDNIATFIGAKAYGASKIGILGVLVGTIVGFFLFPPFGAIIGPLVGGILGELYAKRSRISEEGPKKPFKEALRAGWGLFLGFLAGFVFRFAITVFLFVWLIQIVWF